MGHPDRVNLVYRCGGWGGGGGRRTREVRRGAGARPALAGHTSCWAQACTLCWLQRGLSTRRAAQWKCSARCMQASCCQLVACPPTCHAVVEACRLEVPATPGEAQLEFTVGQAGSFICQVKVGAASAAAAACCCLPLPRIAGWEHRDIVQPAADGGRSGALSLIGCRSPANSAQPALACLACLTPPRPALAFRTPRAGGAPTRGWTARPTSLPTSRASLGTIPGYRRATRRQGRAAGGTLPVPVPGRMLPPGDLACWQGWHAGGGGGVKVPGMGVRAAATACMPCHHSGRCGGRRATRRPPLLPPLPLAPSCLSMSAASSC